jgi:hypothetical protein
MKTIFEVIPNAVHTAAPLAASPITEIQNRATKLFSFKNFKIN